MGATALIGTAIGLGALGDVMGAQAGAEAAEYNTGIAKEQVKGLEVKKIQQKKMLKEQGAREIAATKVAALKSGVTLDGSPTDAIALAHESLAMDELTLERNIKAEQEAIMAGARLGEAQAESQFAALPFTTGSRLLFGAAAL